MPRLTATLIALATAAIPAFPGPEEPGRLPPALGGLLASRAAAYDEATLGFQCRETAHRERSRGGEPREKVTARRYLLQRDDGTRVFQALRGKLGGRSVSAGTPFRFPEPYAWTQLFDPKLRSFFHFEVGDAVPMEGRRVREVRFEASREHRDGRSILEWSGTALVDIDRGDLIRINAEPNFQAERLASQYARAAGGTALGVGNVRLGAGAAPGGRTVTVEFAHLHGELFFPSRVTERRFVMPTMKSRVVTHRTLVLYSDYRFFSAEATAGAR